MTENTVPLTRHTFEGIEEGRAGDREPPLVHCAAPLTCCASSLNGHFGSCPAPSEMRFGRDWRRVRTL
jgi:hypothetical protein